MGRLIASIFVQLFFLGSVSVLAQRQPAVPSDPDQVQAPAIIIGFVGGFVRADNNVHTPVQVAAHLRSAYPSGIYVKVFENRQGDQAHQQICNLLDTNHDGKLSEQEKNAARIILYGISWGASETVQMARQLHAEKIPVLLTIQVDSIAKWHQDDAVIPANVAEAINFYQPNGLLHGENQVRAADPSRTHILGNFRYTYGTMPGECRNYPWWDRLLVKQHTSIECDPTVWKQVENLIRSKLSAVSSQASSQE